MEDDRREQTTGEPWVVVTGASSAIGAAVTARLHAAGRRVLGISRRAAANHLQADLRDPAGAAARLAAWLAQRPSEAVVGFCHIAGVVFADRAEATTADEWRTMMAVNLEAAFWLARTLAPRLQPGAAMVLVSSVDAALACRIGPAAAYGASKAGLEALTRHWAVEWGRRGIRVNAVAPGALAAGAGPDPDVPAMGERVAAATALGRLGSPAEVAAAVAWLLSSEAGYITGQVLRVDGGLGLAYG